LNAYLDASALFAQFVIDPHTTRLVRWLVGAQGRVVLSEWTLAEFSSAIGVATRRGRIGADEQQKAEATVDAWLATRPLPYPVLAGDGESARRFIRNTPTPLRAGDALHLAIVHRLGFALVTFDDRMAAAASDLGIPVEAI
jgi:uncharacterized protein